MEIQSNVILVAHEQADADDEVTDLSNRPQGNWLDSQINASYSGISQTHADVLYEIFLFSLHLWLLFEHTLNLTHNTPL